MTLDNSKNVNNINKLQMHTRPVHSAPILRRINGFGFCLLGTMKDELLFPTFFKVYWFAVLFIPIIPLQVYMVTGSYDSGYRFFGSLSLTKFHSIYGMRSFKIYASAMSEGLLLAFLILLVGLFALCVLFLFKCFLGARC
jgi:hypothetical protein